MAYACLDVSIICTKADVGYVYFFVYTPVKAIELRVVVFVKNQVGLVTDSVKLVVGT